MRAKAVLSFLCAACAAAGAEADFLIIGDPAPYSIFNQYQQQASEQERSDFAPHSPLQVIESDMVLGDQITRAMKFLFRQKVYYLIKNPDGTFSGLKSADGPRVLRGAELFDDTLVVRGSGIMVSDGSGGNIALAEGTKVVRIFKSGPRYYCGAAMGRMVYGWSLLEPRSAWQKYNAGISTKAGMTADTALPDFVQQRILARLDAANQSYRVYFAHFNALTGDEKAVPYWIGEKSGGGLKCRLLGFGSNGGQLSESSQCLAREIGNMLMGTDFRVASPGDDEIEISRKPRGD